ncbi:MAG: hypothetical protein E7544_08985 [Ruminococcaceae bacterium]|nr:hypothetical protein [Oscillospiraceae bacterium]
MATWKETVTLGTVSLVNEITDPVVSSSVVLSEVLSADVVLSSSKKVIPSSPFATVGLLSPRKNIPATAANTATTTATAAIIIFFLGPKIFLLPELSIKVAPQAVQHFASS